MTTEPFETKCDDGVKLPGVLLIPEQPKAVIQFNCGTATKKEFYLPFLTHLAEYGYLCCLWNYRGSDEWDSLKNSSYTFTDYGAKDMPAIKSYLQQRFPHLPFIILGHSAGGQQVGFMNNLDGVTSAIYLAVSSGYYPNMPLSYRLKAYFFFYLFSPFSVWRNGYVKAKPFGFMENLPKKVVFQWRDWLEKENYFFDEKFYGITTPIGHYKNFQFPIHVYYSTDDTISNAKNTAAFWRNVKSEQPITFTELSPKQFGLKKIDHFGYFKKSMKDSLWADVVKRLNNIVQQTT